MAKVHEARPRDDLAPIEKAFRFSSEHHKLQTRDSGDPYMVHPAHGVALSWRTCGWTW